MHGAESSATSLMSAHQRESIGGRHIYMHMPLDQMGPCETGSLHILLQSSSLSHSELCSCLHIYLCLHVTGYLLVGIACI